MAERRAWMALAGFVALAVIVGATGWGGLVTGIAFGLPLVLFVPGLAITAVLWSSSSLGRLERGTIAIGVSLALAALSGLALNWLPGGVDGRRSTMLLGVIALAAIGIVLERDRRQAVLPGGELASGRGAWPSMPLSLRQLAMLGTALGLVVTAVVLAVHSATTDLGPGFTQAWMVTRDPAGQVSIGLQNNEHQARTYDLQLSVQGGTPPSTQGTLVREWKRVRLSPGQKWAGTATVPNAAPGRVAYLRVYRADAPTQVYRQVQVTFGAGGG
ncbi:MAG: DUF1616 domain-containing protein [Candidatus Dormibacteraeota bacterium]|nr:DUF1616 domain-containing protein [Candidatus Dormibacteraeota bacterium]